MHRKSGRKKAAKIILAWMLTIVIVAVVIHQGTVILQAYVDTGEAVHIDPGSIEDSTLIIGSHLIYLHSMNDEIYKVARESASNTGQGKIYYKSELAGGAWFDITDAGSIGDITSQGQVVNAETIRDLDLTHHTKSDGVTYDLRTEKAVCIFDIYPVYELEKMEELEALKMQYDIMKEAGSTSDTVKRNLTYVQYFFANEVQDDVSVVCDARLAALQDYYLQLASGDAPGAETDVVLKVMQKIANERKAGILNTVDTLLSQLQDFVSDVSLEDEEEEMEPDDALITAIANSQSDVSEALFEAQANMLSEGTTVTAAVEYEWALEMVSAAQRGDFAACDGIVQKLLHFYHILDELIVDRSGELGILTDLVSKADTAYKTALGKGESQEYQAEASKNSSHAVLDSIRREDVSEADMARSELQFFVKAQASRTEEAQVEEYVTKQIQGTSAFLAAIPNDAYREALEETVQKYITWLQELLSEMKSDMSSEEGSIEELYEKKESLQEDKMAALDNLDLDGARLIDAKLASLEEEIREMESVSAGELAGLQEQKSRLEAQAAANPNDASIQSMLANVTADMMKVEAAVSGESTAANVTELKSQALAKIKEKDSSESGISSLANSVEGLGSALDTGSAMALSALKEIYQAMAVTTFPDNQHPYDDLMEKVEEMAAQAQVVEPGEKLSQSAAIHALEEALGGTIRIKSGSGTETAGSRDGSGSGDDGSGSTGTGGTEGSGKTGTGAGGNEKSGNETGGSGSTGAGTGGSGNTGNTGNGTGGNEKSGNETGGSGSTGTGAEGTGGSGSAGTGTEGTGGSGSTGTGGSGSTGTGAGGTGGNGSTRAGTEGTGGSGSAGTGAGGTGGSGSAGTGTEGTGGSGSTGIGAGRTGGSGSAGMGTEGTGGSGSTGTETGGSGSTGTGTGGTEGSESTGTGAGGSGGAGTEGSGNTGSGTGSAAGGGGAESGGAGTEENPAAGSGNAASSGSAGSVETEGISQEDMASAVLALSEYAGETGNQEIEALANGMAASLQRENPYMFTTHKSGGEIFIPADVLAKYLGCRYLWNDTKKTAILSNKREFYSFTAFSLNVGLQDGQTEHMEVAAEFGGDTLYVPGSYVSAAFLSQITDISGTDYSMLVNDKVVEKSQELLSVLKEKGGS